MHSCEFHKLCKPTCAELRQAGLFSGVISARIVYCHLQLQNNSDNESAVFFVSPFIRWIAPLSKVKNTRIPKVDWPFTHASHSRGHPVHRPRWYNRYCLACNVGQTDVEHTCCARSIRWGQHHQSAWRLDIYQPRPLDGIYLTYCFVDHTLTPQLHGAVIVHIWEINLLVALFIFFSTLGLYLVIVSLCTAEAIKWGLHNHRLVTRCMKKPAWMV